MRKGEREGDQERREGRREGGRGTSVELDFRVVPGVESEDVRDAELFPHSDHLEGGREGAREGGREGGKGT
jgi:hypothetical protein